MLSTQNGNRNLFLLNFPQKCRDLLISFLLFVSSKYKKEPMYELGINNYEKCAKYSMQGNSFYQFSTFPI